MPAHWPAPKASKYHAKVVVVDGHRFPSQHEADRYHELLLLSRAGHIRSLRQQVAFPLYAPVITSGHYRQVATYICDFAYEERQPDHSWRRVVEDAKGVRTALYKLKRKWLEVQHGLHIREV